MGILDDLPTLAEVAAQRVGKPILKGKSRLELGVASDRDERKAEEKWKRAVRTRDGMQCRWCRRKVEVMLDRKPERAECHHVSGREVKAIRWRRENGVLLCLVCHERVTGRVNERFLIASTHTFTVDHIAYINADKPLKFRRVA